MGTRRQRPIRTLTRGEAIENLRHELLKEIDSQHSLCLVAARRGIFCKGFAQWSPEELRQRFPDLLGPDPAATRAQTEDQANQRSLARQVGERLPCDVASDQRVFPCAGWDEFHETELARFHLELCGEKVRVVPDD